MELVFIRVTARILMDFDFSENPDPELQPCGRVMPVYQYFSHQSKIDKNKNIVQAKVLITKIYVCLQKSGKRLQTENILTDDYCKAVVSVVWISQSSKDSLMFLQFVEV